MANAKQTFITVADAGQLRRTPGAAFLGYKTYSWRFKTSGETTVDVQMQNITTQIEEVIISSQSATRYFCRR